MEIKKGTFRTALVFKGFVIKLPRIYLSKALETFFKTLKVGGVIYHFRRYNWEQYNTIPNYLLKGIIDNWLEYVFYKKNKSFQLLVPTIFSLFGLLNIQSYCEPLECKEEDLWCQLSEIAGESIWKDSHAFANPKNFGVYEGKIRMMDYGSKETQKALKECADKIFFNFDFSYSWEERKKQLYPEEGG
jgi:hypothetical protein